jgi:hypothetical protein
VRWALAAVPAVVLAAGCGRAGSSGPADAVLRAYTPGLRLGETLREAEGKVGKLWWRGPSGAHVGRIAAPLHGFDSVMVGTYAGAEGVPSDDYKVNWIRLAGARLDSLPQIRARITALFGGPPVQGCMYDAGGDRPLFTAYRWRRAAGPMVRLAVMPPPPPRAYGPFQLVLLVEKPDATSERGWRPEPCPFGAPI